MMLGLTEPTKGMARIGGFNSTREPLKVKRITGYVPDMAGTLEWHQSERKLWPDTGRRPRTIEELNPQLGTGDCGSANLALALALACARFEFRVEPVSTIMICDISDQPWRGAVCLQQVSG